MTGARRSFEGVNAYHRGVLAAKKAQREGKAPVQKSSGLNLVELFLWEQGVTHSGDFRTVPPAKKAPATNAEEAEALKAIAEMMG